MRKCDKCKEGLAIGSYTVVVCKECRKEYARCEDCGGVRGAARSLKSHRGLYHPKKPSRF